MQLAVERAAELEAISPADLLEVHRVLLERASNSQIAGRFRASQNWIGGNDDNPCGAAFVPPPAGELDRLLDDLCAFVGELVLPPLVQAAIAHAQFETIHPFEDGNGRTGRTPSGCVAGELARAAAPRREPARRRCSLELINALPAHPVCSVPVATAATGRTRPAVANAIEQLETAATGPP